MFGLNLNLIGGAVLAVLAAGAGGYLYARAGVSAEIDAAVEGALADARKTTERAINELADEAERARMRRRLCVDDPRGMRWSFADNDCVKAGAQP